MKLYTKILSLVLVSSAVTFIWATSTHPKAESAITTVAVAPVHACHCGPTEHWLFKACAKNYNAQFPQANFPEDNDTEGLPTNVVEAINMLAQDILFFAQDGTPIAPTLNAKGKLILPMVQNSDYVLCKEILHNVDVATTLTAQELYEQWTKMLQAMKSAQ